MDVGRISPPAPDYCVCRLRSSPSLAGRGCRCCSPTASSGRHIGTGSPLRNSGTQVDHATIPRQSSLREAEALVDGVTRRTASTGIRGSGRYPARQDGSDPAVRAPDDGTPTRPASTMPSSCRRPEGPRGMAAGPPREEGPRGSSRTDHSTRSVIRESASGSRSPSATTWKEVLHRRERPARDQSSGDDLPSRHRGPDRRSSRCRASSTSRSCAGSVSRTSTSTSRVTTPSRLASSQWRRSRTWWRTASAARSSRTSWRASAATSWCATPDQVPRRQRTRSTASSR